MRRTRLYLSLLAVLSVIALVLWYMGRITVHLASWSGESWSASGITVTYRWRGARPRGTSVQVRAANLPAIGKITGISFHCAHLNIGLQGIACTNAQASISDPRFTGAPFDAAFNYKRAGGALSYRLRHVGTAGGQLEVDAASNPKHRYIDLTGRGLMLTKLPALIHDLVEVPALSGNGRVDLSAHIEGPKDTLTRASFEATVTAASVSNESGTAASQNLDGTIRLKVTDLTTQPIVSAAVEIRRGELYVDPLYLDIKEKPLALTAQAVWRPKSHILTITNATADHPGVMRARASGTITFKGKPSVTELTASLTDANLAKFYPSYLRPFSIGTGFDDLEASGHIRGELHYQARGIISARLDLIGVRVDDHQGRFGLHDLNGTLAWRSAGAPLTSRIRWRSGHIYAVDLGASRVEVAAAGTSFRLMRAAHIPVLDGALEINTLFADHVGSPNARWQFSGQLTPVSMQALTRKLGWPTMAGKLSGKIPGIQFANGTLTLDGQLEIRAFDGITAIRHLKLQQPFGLVPQLYADADFADLDLNALTRTFSFGNIQGRLSGHVHNLQLQNWEPVRFNAAFYTPKGDDSRHVISQKAVNNLTSLAGGGIGNALSRSALRVFKNFSYDRLGLSCALDNNVCSMGGVAAAKQGYYIVKGGGLPRIDVIGYTREVDWPVLLARLKRVTQNNGAVVR